MVQNIIYFESNDLIKAYFETIEFEKQKLFDSFFKLFLSDKLSKEEYLNEINKKNLIIIEMFNQR